MPAIRPRGSLTAGETKFVTERFRKEQDGAPHDGHPEVSEPAA